MASPAFYERIAASMPMSTYPAGCCEGHYDRLGIEVPAAHGGLCQGCIYGVPLGPEDDAEEEQDIAPPVRRVRGKDRKPRKCRPRAPRRTVQEILRNKASGKKVCTMCGHEKELFLFRKQSSNADGRSCACAMCLRVNWMNKYYRRNG